MTNTQGNNKKFWNRYAKLYDFEISLSSKTAYARMYKMMSESLNSNMNVLELAAGTGLIALNIAPFVHSVIATDFSPKMIKAASSKKKADNVTFCVEDATQLSFVSDAFDAVIISNALHVMPDPAGALSEIRRVLRPNGLLIAPNFTHGHIKQGTWDVNARFLKLLGFETYAKWLPGEYAAFISNNGFEVEKWTVLRAAFPLVYLEARYRES